MEPSVTHNLRLVHPPPRERRKVVPNEVLGVTIFILTEMKLFAGFISAFTISKAAAPMWPPAGQPRLPLEETAINTAALLLSGALAWWAGRQFERVGPRSARWPLVGSIALGAFFLAFQGMEWVALLREGLTLTSSTHGAFFYLIVGAHGLHALGGLAVMLVLLRRLQGERLSPDEFWAGRLFWYFVVLLWPVLYWQVYR
jgi:heme/copper-type cytochrome/quinol oxidase subunit 3